MNSLEYKFEYSSEMKIHLAWAFVSDSGFSLRNRHHLARHIAPALDPSLAANIARGGDAAQGKRGGAVD